MDQLELINQIDALDTLEDINDDVYEYTPSINVSDVIKKIDMVKHNLNVANNRGLLNNDKNKAIKDMLNTIDYFIRQDKYNDTKHLIIKAIKDNL